VVLATTNSLLVNATLPQHARIRAIIELADVTTPQQAIPFEIYFLENQEWISSLIKRLDRRRPQVLIDVTLVGMLFRGVSNTDVQSKLYIFVRAQVIRPVDAQTAAMKDLLKVSYPGVATASLSGV